MRLRASKYLFLLDLEPLPAETLGVCYLSDSSQFSKTMLLGFEPAKYKIREVRLLLLELLRPVTEFKLSSLALLLLGPYQVLSLGHLSTYLQHVSFA